MSDLSEFECKFCGCLPTKPVLLPCGHSVCEACASRNSNGGFLNCPQCGAQSTMADLRANPQLEQMIAVLQKETMRRPRAPSLEPTKIQDTITQSDICTHHAQKYAYFDLGSCTFYCETCLREPTFPGGNLRGLEEASQSAAVTDTITAIASRQKRLEKALTRHTQIIERLLKEVDISYEHSKKDINTEFDNLIRLLEERRSAVLTHLDERRDDIKNELTTTHDATVNMIDKISDTMEERHSRQRSGEPFRILSMIRLIGQRLDEIESEVENCQFERCVSLQAGFSPITHMIIEDHGDVYLREPEAILNKAQPIETLGWHMYNFASQRINEFRNNMAPMAYLLKERCHVENGYQKTLATFTQASIPPSEPCRYVQELWEMFVGERKLCAGRSRDAVIQNMLNSVVPSLQEASQGLEYRRRETDASASEARNNLHISFENLKKSLIELEKVKGDCDKHHTAMQTKLKNGKAVDKKLKNKVAKCLPVYHQALDTYNMAVRTYMSQKQAMTGQLSTAFQSLSQLESDRITAVRQAISQFASQQGSVLVAFNRHLSNLIATSRALDPGVSIGAITRQAIRVSKSKRVTTKPVSGSKYLGRFYDQNGELNYDASPPHFDEDPWKFAEMGIGNGMNRQGRVPSFFEENRANMALAGAAEDISRLSGARSDTSIPPNMAVPFDAVVLYDWDADEDDEITVKEGVKIEVLQYDSEGWSEVRVKSSGLTGSLPSNYMELDLSSEAVKSALNRMGGSSAPQQSSTQKMQSSPVVTPQAAPATGGERRAKALYDHNATESDELTIKEDQIVVVLDYQPDGWSTVVNDQGQQGLVPGNYIQLL